MAQTDLPTAILPGRTDRSPLPRLQSFAGAVRGGMLDHLVRFTGVGFICTVASLLLYLSLRPAFGAQLANLFALVSTSVLNTALNRRFTFGIRERRHRDHLGDILLITLALSLTSASLGVLHAVNPSAGAGSELSAVSAASFCATAVRFLLLRQLVFRRHSLHPVRPACPEVAAR